MFLLVHRTGLRRRPAQAGVSIVEFLVASTMTLVGVASYLATIVKVDDLRRDGEGVAMAFEAARMKLAELQAAPFGELVARYDDDTANDPAGVAAPGATFAVAGLERRSEPGAAVGEVLLPLDGAGRIREDLVLPELGFPRDLDLDGVIDSADHTDDHVILPVLVRVRWDDKGERVAVFKTILYER